MPPIIKILDQHCINQIAAGEVVERPLSVVKELVENAIDAGAKKIEISVEGGGQSLIKVRDDGCGMLSEDLKLAILPHATSKITRIEDLNDLRTLGFRGEALSSIAAISKLSIVSRRPEEAVGWEIRVEGGKLVSFTETGCAPGTVVTVTDLFFNTPARRKFLRSPNTEFGLISDMIGRLALANPDISFSLRHPQTPVLNTTGRGDLLDTIAAVLGNETARKMLPLEFKGNNIEISGFIGSPELVRNSRDGVTFIVNGRFVRSQLLYQALKEGYHTLIPA
ncbi:MAG: DNA mismatch repair endonuclease MutL, partial [Peptococcaceae bacterium]|nr:DNA mismatch repair endonuclease MutL [Peptococcaceae bacterium]